MDKIIVLALGMLLSFSVSARQWSSYGSVSKIKVYEGSTISFRIQNNTIQTVSCHTDKAYFIVDPGLTQIDFILSSLLAAQVSGKQVKVLPISPDTCSGNGTVVGSIEYM